MLSKQSFADFGKLTSLTMEDTSRLGPRTFAALAKTKEVLQYGGQTAQKKISENFVFSEIFFLCSLTAILQDLRQSCILINSTV
jgi:hypothetical protein